MAQVFHVTIHADDESFTVTRTDIPTALRAVICKAHSVTDARIINFERHPKYTRLFDYAVNVVYESSGKTHTQLVHIFRYYGTVDSQYLEVSNELIFGKQEVLQ